MPEVLAMDLESGVVFAVVLAIGVVTIGGLGRLVRIQPGGIEIGTLFGRRFLAWSEVRDGVIHAPPVLPVVLVVLRLKGVPFFSIYRSFGLILRNTDENDAKLKALSESIDIRYS
jgi:hypothetical protein